MKSSAFATCGEYVRQDGGRLGTDSLLEHRHLVLLRSDPVVKEMKVQSKLFRYQDSDGVWKQHCIDIEATLVTGHTIFYALKPKALRERSRIDVIMGAIARDFVGDREKTIFRVIDEDCQALWQIHNAKLINRALADPDYDSDEKVAIALWGLGSAIKVIDLRALTGVGPQLVLSVARLLFHGLVRLTDGNILNMGAQVGIDPSFATV